MPTPSKKLLILAILEILQKDTDEEHHLFQAEMLTRLQVGYGLSATRKTLRQNLSALQEADYPIEYDKGWYYVHPFCTAELNLMVDSVLFNASIPHVQNHDMIQRISALGGEHFRPTLGGTMNRPVNPEFMLTYEVLHEAIEQHRMVSFHYGNLDVDKQLHLRTTEDGQPKLYVVSPYAVVQSNGHNYLIANVSPHDALTHFRLDRIQGIMLTDATIRDVRSLPGCQNGLDPLTYLTEHQHMFSGKVGLHRLRCKRYLAGDVMDWFGMDVQFEQVTEENFYAYVHADALSLKYWLMMYAEHAELAD